MKKKLIFEDVQWNNSCPKCELITPSAVFPGRRTDGWLNLLDKPNMKMTLEWEEPKNETNT